MPERLRHFLKFAKAELWDYFRETTVHGFGYVADGGHAAVKIFWACVVAAGFACTYVLCDDDMSDWAREPFVTTIRSGRVTDLQFPTVTVCQEPYIDVDRWGLVRRIANNVPFDCRDFGTGSWANETCDEARNSNATMAIIERLAKIVIKRVGRLSADEHGPRDFSEKYEVTDLLEFDDEDVVNLAKEHFARAEDWDAAVGRGGGNGSYYTYEYTPEEGISYAKGIAMKLMLLIPPHEIKFGTFLENFVALVGVIEDEELEAKNLSCNFNDYERPIHDYFVDLAEAAGFSGGLSLVDLPAVFGVADRLAYGGILFQQVQCSIEKTLENEIKRRKAWHDFVFLKKNVHKHPCDAKEFDACSFWADTVLQKNNLTTLTKILKISSHLGHWDDGYSISTHDFHALREDEFLNFYHSENEHGEKNINGPSTEEEKEFGDYAYDCESDFSGGALPRPMENSFVLYEESDTSGATMDFRPTVTDRGLCLAANADPVASLLKKGHPYTAVFEEAFKEEIMNPIPVANNNGTGELYGLHFYAVNHFAPNALGDGRRAFFDVALNWRKDAFNVRSGKVTVRTGYHTIIRVQAPQLTTISEDVAGMDPASRGCRLTSEAAEGADLLEEYTQAGCRFECLLRHSARKCRCVPWNYPNPAGGVTRTCDLYSSRCFETAMARQNEVHCDCPDDCNGLRFSYSVQQVPTDPETVCADGKSPFFRLVNYQGSSFPNTFLMDMAALVYGKSYYGKARFVLDDWTEELAVDTCWRLFQKSGALVSVQVDSAFHTEIGKSRKWSFGSMVGTIGGNLGLFTGMSIISSVELVFWILRALARYSTVSYE